MMEEFEYLRTLKRQASWPRPLKTCRIDRVPTQSRQWPFIDRSGEPVVAYVIGLGMGRSPGSHNKGKEQIAILVSAQNQARAPVESIGSLLGLTATENRVLSHIADGLNRQETATQMGVADSTVKSHLDHIYAKTGMASQVELVKSLSKLSLPLRADYNVYLSIRMS